MRHRVNFTVEWNGNEGLAADIRNDVIGALLDLDDEYIGVTGWTVIPGPLEEVRSIFDFTPADKEAKP